MQRITYYIGIALVVSVLEIGGAQTTASAAKWHAGTPKILRGLYQSTLTRKQNPAAGFAPVVSIAAKTFSLGISNNPEQLVKHVKYRHAHGVYYLRGNLQPIGWIKAGRVTIALQKKHHALIFVPGKKSFYHFNEKFKQTKHVKGY